MTLNYAVEDGLGAEEFVDVLKRSGLDARRPADKPDIIRGMVDNASLVVTARDGDKISLLLLSAPDGMEYYPKIGLDSFDNCFGIRQG